MRTGTTVLVRRVILGLGLGPNKPSHED
jgi:hypothetical protein